MASLKEIRNRVRSVTNTQKITSAMKLVAAAKLRQAQEAAEAARPYAQRMQNVIATLAQSVDPSFSPLFRTNERADKTLVILFSSDRGLCGGFNNTLFRRTKAVLQKQQGVLGDVTIAPIGKKGESYVRRESMTRLPNWKTQIAAANIELAEEVIDTALDGFLEGGFDRVYLAYNRFESALTQTPVFEQLLPLDPESIGQPSEQQDEENGPDFLYEPSREALLDTLLPQFLNTKVYSAALESVASEFGARMTAMDSASNNANDLIDKLTLQMNRARQAIITTELSEITAGSEALKG